MKTLNIIVAALSLLGASLAPAQAAPIDYLLNVPLFSGGMEVGSLKGTLSPTDDVVNDFVSSQTTFTLLDTSAGTSLKQDWTGLAFIMPSDGQTSVSFTSDTPENQSLYFSLVTTASGDSSSTGQVNICGISGSCTFYDTVGASMIRADATPITLPGSGTDNTGTNVGLSPVPLPPAVWMFGGALLILAGMGAMTRRALVITAPAAKA